MSNIKELDTKYHLSPMSDWRSIADEGGRTLISRAEGIYLWDTNGRKYLDSMSGLWCVNVGYSCKPVKEAVARQLEILPYYNAFFKTSNLPVANLSKLLSSLCPGDISHFFYGNSGSDANDTVFKLVRAYWQSLEQPQKRVFISRKNSYHGSTVLAAALGGMDSMHALNDLKFEDIHHIAQPYSFDAGRPYNDESFGLECAAALEQKIQELGAENVAAFIGEPIQGAGGVIIPPDSYWPEVQKITKKYNILLISDEVICGFGRTGKWFGGDNWRVKPDIMTMAKGITSGYMPLSAVGISDAVYAVLTNQKKEFSHGYTYSSHPVACEAALANLNYIMETELLETLSEDIIPYFHAKGQELTGHPIVGEVRFKGMLMAFELVANKETRQRFKEDIASICRDFCLDIGFIMRACKHTMVIAPPLIISKEEIDTLFLMILQSFDKTFKKSQGV